MQTQPALDLARVFRLEPHGPDTYVAESPHYPWGRIYGGLVIAQALWAATQTVRDEHSVHSLHAYFILGGEFAEPVRYEVDRVRNGRSFTTRRVIARQSAGAILTLECSFQRYEQGAESQSQEMPAGLLTPDVLPRVYDAGLDRCELVLEQHLRLEQQAADDRALAIVDRATGDESQQALALVLVQIRFDVGGDQVRNMGHAGRPRGRLDRSGWEAW